MIKMTKMILKPATILLLSLAFFTYFSICFPNHHTIFLSLSNNASAAHHLRSLTQLPHVAGTVNNNLAADYVLSTLIAAGISAHKVSYNVLLNSPIKRSLKLVPGKGMPPVRFELYQEVYEGDPFADVAWQVMPTFHAYAKSGNASGPVVYVNYGRVEDYAKLKEMGVNVFGTVALAKYGKIFRGDIVENAYEAGAIGVVIYTDRKDYGGGGGNGSRWFPDEKWMPPTGVQVGSVIKGKGDPTTPGWASTWECERLSDEEMEERGVFPHIPSLPVSWADGDEIHRSIGGHMADDDWQGGVDAPVYRVGPGPGILDLSYEGRNAITPIQNVIGVIEGEVEPDRYVILGNHRDAWSFGAVDPNSGTAALLELAERLGKLMKTGWRPRRTIVLCNWDAEEYALIGSTEWVEENREMISLRVVAYLNVDTGVLGPGFYSSATPQLDELIKESTQKVQDPDKPSQTIYEASISSGQNFTIGRLGGGESDFAAFVQHIGVPSADMSFGDDYPVYHSMYDDFVWMQKFGDPLFHRHVAAASIWGLVALQLADKEILPFNYLSYALELQKSAKELQTEVLNEGINLDPLFTSIEQLKETAIKVNNQKKAMEKERGWLSKWRREDWRVRDLNDRLMMTERAFTDRDGLSGKPWYKHLIYAPSKYNGYGSKIFPGIGDEIEKAKNGNNTTDSWRSVQHEVWRVARAITQASLVLNGKLT